MLELHNSQDEIASSIRSASLQIARFRSALDWMLAHPLWEDAFACSLSELELKGRRQGIAQA